MVMVRLNMFRAKNHNYSDSEILVHSNVSPIKRGNLFKLCCCSLCNL